MPTPDNKRERGAAAKPMPGQTIAPKGTSGVVNANYAANAATSDIQAPSQIKIGQQARVLDDGSKLATILQGAASGAQAGIESYQKMYEYTSNKNLADWETKMAEHYRLVDGDSKKMAEWSRASGFAPNDVTAKRYHQLMAAMEDKEETQYENERIEGFAISLSTKRPTEALKFINEEYAKADPNSISGKWLQQQRNEANQITVQNTIEAERTMDAQQKQSSVDALAERLGSNPDFDPESLTTPYANFVAQSYALWGESDRIRISDKGVITYNADNDKSYTATFDAIPQDMALEMQKDIGNYVGAVDSSTDATMFNQATNALDVGFKSQYTAARRPESQAQTGEAGDIAQAIASTGGQTGPNTAAIISANNITQATDKEGNPIDARNRSSWATYWTRTTDAIINNEEFSPEERVRRLKRLQSSLNSSFGDGEENNIEARRRYGMSTYAEYTDLVAPIQEKIKEKIIEETSKTSGDASAKATQLRAKARTAEEMEDASKYGVEVVQNAVSIAGVGGDSTVTLYTTDSEGKLGGTISFRDREGMLKYMADNPSTIGSGFSVRLNMQGMSDAFGRGTALSPDGHVWAGSANQPPPQEAIDRAKSDRVQYDNAVASDKVSVHATMGGLGSLDPLTIDRAATHRLGLIDPSDPASADLALDLLDMTAALPTPDLANGVRSSLQSNEAFKQMMRPTLTPNQLSGLEPDESGKLAVLDRLNAIPGNREFVNELITGTSDPAPNSAEATMIWRFNEGRHFQSLHAGIARIEGSEAPPLDGNALDRLQVIQSFQSDSNEAFTKTYETFKGLMQTQAEYDAKGGTTTMSPADALMQNPDAAAIAERWNEQATATDGAVPSFREALLSDDINIRDSALLFAQRTYEAANSDIAYLEMSGSSEAVFSEIDSLSDQEQEAYNSGRSLSSGYESRKINARDAFEREAISRSTVPLPYDGAGSIEQMDLTTVPFEEGAEYMPIQMQAVQALVLGSVETKGRTVKGTMETSDLQNAARVSLERSEFEFADTFDNNAPTREMALEAVAAFAQGGRQAMYAVSDKYYKGFDRGHNHMDELIASIAEAADITRSVKLEGSSKAGSIGITANWKEGPLNETPSFFRKTGTPPKPEVRYDSSKKSKSPHLTLSGKPIGPIGNQPGGVDTAVRDFVNDNIQAPLRNFFDSLFGNGG